MVKSRLHFGPNLLSDRLVSSHDRHSISTGYDVPIIPIDNYRNRDAFRVSGSPFFEIPLFRGSGRGYF